MKLEEKKKRMAARMYIEHLPSKVGKKGRGFTPKETYEREASELKRGGYKGSIGWKHLSNKSGEERGDVRGAREHLKKLGIKHKEAYVESATHKKGDWMVHYK